MTPLAAARAYAARGWHVLPARAGAKVPLTPHGVHDATTAADTIAAWWRRWPTAGVAIATGAASGLVVLDVDARHGGDDTLADLERAHGRLPDTPRVLTGGGGLHVYLAHPGGAVPCSVGALGPGLDVRADGGHVVAPPSPHASGRRYAWEVGASPADVPLAPVPPWLLARLVEQRSRAPRPADEWAALVRDGADAGRRNDAVARLAGYLLRRRPAPHVVLELVRAWSASRCRPPLADDELVRTVDSIARRELRRREVSR
jgi:hypothetical protein